MRLRAHVKAPVYLILALLMGACGGLSTADRTRIAEGEQQQTQIADLYVTATTVAERQLVTVEAAITRVARQNNRQAILLSTLEYYGLAVVIPPTATVPPSPSAMPTSPNTPTPLPSSSPLPSVLPQPTASERPTALSVAAQQVQVTPITAEPTPTSTFTTTPTSTPPPTLTSPPTSTLVPTLTPSLTSTPTATYTPSITPTGTHPPTNTPSATATTTVTPTATLTVTPSATATMTPSPTATLTPTVTATSTPTATATMTMTVTPSMTPTPTTTHTPSITPTPRVISTVPNLSPRARRFTPTPVGTYQGVLNVTPGAGVTSDAPDGTPTETNLENITAMVMASGVNNLNCPTQVTYDFGVGSSQIYLIARAVDIPAGTEISARWIQYDIILATTSITTQTAIGSECVYLAATPNDFSFLPGEYTVDMQLDGEPAGYTIEFTIR